MIEKSISSSNSYHFLAGIFYWTFTLTTTISSYQTCPYHCKRIKISNLYLLSFSSSSFSILGNFLIQLFKTVTQKIRNKKNPAVKMSLSLLRFSSKSGQEVYYNWIVEKEKKNFLKKLTLSFGISRMKSFQWKPNFSSEA